jgi:enamine deaminase RidA (YjgF/YER057c/UK114 family)
MKLTPLLAILLLSCAPVFAADPAVRYVESDGRVVAAVVPGSAELVHTGQILTDDERADARPLLFTVRKIVGNFGGDPEQLVKVNVVAATQDVADNARAKLADVRAPISFVIGALPHGRKIGIDVVAPVTKKPPEATSAASVLRAGPRLYISGQAEKAATPADAAAKTIESLVKTLEDFGSNKSAVVQAKCFLTPMGAAPDVMDEFAKVFGKQKLPLVFVEWKSDLPIEIELIAAAPPAAADAPAIEYLTPPAMKPSPVFARVVRINRGDVIYTAGLYPQKPGSGEEQVLSIFEQLQQILEETRGDLRHLAKATYYVSDDDASKQLNVLRPKFYDPQRPPAASKAVVNGVGVKDRSISIDMIGVSAVPQAP